MRAGMTATAMVREFTSLRTDCRMRRVLRMVPKSTMQPQMANAYESNHTSRALEMVDAITRIMPPLENPRCIYTELENPKSSC